jgi:hypothetical protein
VTVLVKGDSTFEPGEQFFVNLSNVNANATILGGQGVGTITNDDPQPSITISDVTQAEGSGGGTTAFNFALTPVESKFDQYRCQLLDPGQHREAAR